MQFECTLSVTSYLIPTSYLNPPVVLAVWVIVASCRQFLTVCGNGEDMRVVNPQQ